MSVNNNSRSHAIVSLAFLSLVFFGLAMFCFAMWATEENEKSNKQEVIEVVDKNYPTLVKSLDDDKLSDETIDAMLAIDSKTGKDYFTPILLKVSGGDFTESYKKQVKIKLKEVKKDWTAKK